MGGFNELIWINHFIPDFKRLEIKKLRKIYLKRQNFNISSNTPFKELLISDSFFILILIHIHPPYPYFPFFIHISIYMHTVHLSCIHIFISLSYISLLLSIFSLIHISSPFPICYLRFLIFLRTQTYRVSHKTWQLMNSFECRLPNAG